jgi:GntR family transcriptional repressor for pyruvate dehydrogenase complex
MDWNDVTPSATLSLPERLSVDLERMIVDGELVPGEKLPAERELAQHFGVSRVSIREALRELENRGLVDRRPGRGTIVLQPGERSAALVTSLGLLASLNPELQHILELRAVIEPPIAAIAASRATARDVAMLRELVESMEADPAQERYAELDKAFHEAIARYAHNPLFETLNGHIAGHIALSRAERYQTKARRRASSAAHRRIFEAIAAGDGELAEQEARAHVLDVSNQIAQAAIPKGSAKQ